MIKLDISQVDFENLDKVNYTLSLYSFDEIYNSLVKIESQCRCFGNFQIEFLKNLNEIKENQIDL